MIYDSIDRVSFEVLASSEASFSCFPWLVYNAFAQSPLFVLLWNSSLTTSSLFFEFLATSFNCRWEMSSAKCHKFLPMSLFLLFCAAAIIKTVEKLIGVWSLARLNLWLKFMRRFFLSFFARKCFRGLIQKRRLKVPGKYY